MKTDRNKFFISSSTWLVVIALLLSVFIVTVSWNLINWSNNQARISKQRDNMSLTLMKKFDNDTSKTIILNASDVKDINKHIDALSEKSNLETEHNINWINTFLTIGISLLAIVGGLLPLLINFFSKEHLQEKIRNVESTLAEQISKLSGIKKKFQAVKKTADSANEKMVTFEGRFDTLHTSFNSLEKKVAPFEARVEHVEGAVKKVPFITSLILHNSISRLLSADNIRYYAEDKREKRLTKILDGIKSSLQECANDDPDNLSNENIEFIIAVINDFKVGFLYSPIKHTLSKKVIQKIDEYCVFLSNFNQQQSKKFPELFTQAAISLQTIIELISTNVTV